MFPSHCHYITHHHNWQHYPHLWILRTRGGGGHQGNIYFQIQQNSSTLEFSNSEAGRRLAKKYSRTETGRWHRTSLFAKEQRQEKGKVSFLSWHDSDGQPCSRGSLTLMGCWSSKVHIMGKEKEKIKGKTESSVLWLEK